jgi:hypothetical protein
MFREQVDEIFEERFPSKPQEKEGLFSRVTFPIVRRVFASTIANELVSVQPMSLPAGLIFFTDFKYGEIDEDLQEQK